MNLFLDEQSSINIMEAKQERPPFSEVLNSIVSNLQGQRLADVFRFISFIPGETYGPHRHIRIEMNYVKKGTCMMHIGRETVNFHEGEIMIISSDVEHKFEAGSKGTTLMQLEFLPEIFTSIDTSLQLSKNIFEQSSVSLFSEKNKLIKIVGNVRIMRAIQRILDELSVKKSFYQELVVMYYAELLILITRYMDENFLPVCNNPAMKKAISFIRSHYKDDISISLVAEEAGVGDRYLRNLFAKYLNLGPLEYLNQIRINKAVELLRNTELSVKEVCFECGFKSSQYFSRIFKKQMKVSPHNLVK